ncbi:hypothetical protein TorRG33x02_204520, partial [Trema orientale]
SCFQGRWKLFMHHHLLYPARFVTGCKEEDILEIVRDILKHSQFWIGGST